jgi:hypothetical protein
VRCGAAALSLRVSAVARVLLLLGGAASLILAFRDLGSRSAAGDLDPCPPSASRRCPDGVGTPLVRGLALVVDGRLIVVGIMEVLAVVAPVAIPKAANVHRPRRCRLTEPIDPTTPANV